MSSCHAPSEKKLPSLCLALVHNNNQERNALIKPSIAALAAFLKKHSYQVETIEESWQPEILEDSFYRFFKKKMTYELLGYQWSKYRLLSDFPIKKLLSSFYRIIKSYGFKGENHFKAQRKSSAIDAAITAKQTKIWSDFLKSGADILVCFEDDALFTKESEEKFLHVLHHLQNYYLENNLYINLSEGSDLPSLKIQNLEESREGFFTFYKKPVTNTICAYLTNKRMIQHFESILDQYPFYRLIKADWTVNKILLELDKRGIQGYCFHTQPSVFYHGSVSGQFTTWQ